MSEEETESLDHEEWGKWTWMESCMKMEGLSSMNKQTLKTEEERGRGERKYAH